MITKLTISAFLMFFVFACSNIRNDKTIRNTNALDITKSPQNFIESFSSEQMQVNQNLAGKIFMVKDTSKYSPIFINGLRELKDEYESLILIDDKIYHNSKVFNGEKYINRLDTIAIPSELPINVSTKYKVEKGNKKYLLTLRRVNFTNIEYELKSNDIIIKTGEAILPGAFILGAETGEDEDGITYGLIQYSEEKSECLTFIEIEIGSGNKVEFSMFFEKDKTKEIINTPLSFRKVE